MKRVLLGVHHYPPRNVAGAEWRVHRTARYLIAHGFDVRVITVEHVDRGPADGGLAWDDDVFDGVPVRRLSFDRAVLSDDFLAEYRHDGIGTHFGQLMDAWRPDLFHLISGYLLTGSVLEAAYARRIPAVVSLTDFYFVCRRLTLLRSNGQLSTGRESAETCWRCLGEERNSLRQIGQAAPGLMDWYWRQQTGPARRFGDRRRYLLPVLSRAAALISPSQFLADTLIGAGVSGDHLHVIRQGRDLPGSEAVAAAWTPSDRLRLVYAGQVSEHKGLHVVLEALRRIPALDLSLSVFGDLERFPRYVRRLRDLAGADPRVAWRGLYRGEAGVLSALAEADVALVPSLWYENSPNSVLEAFACGRPVVTSRLGGMAELVRHGVNGLTFPAGDAGALADLLHELATDRAALARLRAGITPVDTVATEMARMLAVYRAAEEGRA